MHLPATRLCVLAAVAALGAALYGLRVPGLSESLLGMLALFVCSAAALSASRVRPLAPVDAVHGVLAAMAANMVTPGGVGGSLVTLRLHRRSGLSGEEAVAAVTLRALASGVAGVLVVLFAAVELGRQGPALPSGPRLVALLCVVAAALTVVLVLALSCPLRRGRLRARAAAAAGAVLAVLRCPRRTLVLVAGAVGVLAAQLLILDGAVRAVSGHVAVSHLLVALLGSTAARAALPSPGGVGPVEAALVAGLAAVGLPVGSAALAVGVYRTAALGLPVLAGALALRHLRRTGLL